jgi:glycosyltransferase involved in cell wall biosynthesis
VADGTRVLNEQLARGDFLMCASEKQRDFWLGQLSALGRINPQTYDEDETLESLITVVPFGLPSRPAVHDRDVIKGVVPGIGRDDKVILWGGGVYNWFDPITLVHAVDRLRHRRPDVRLFFLGLRHPNPEVPEMRMATALRRTASELGLVGSHVFFNEEWIPYEERQNYLLEADVAVSTHLDHLETAYSFRTRILDYIWAAVPVVATKGDALADLIDENGLGITVPPNDVAALEEALFRLVDDDELAAVCHKNLAELAPRFTWTKVLEPLLEFCRAPRRAPDLVRADLETLQARLPGALRGPAPPRSLRSKLREDTAVARTYLQSGGPKLVVWKAWQRFRRLAGRPVG